MTETSAAEALPPQAIDRLVQQRDVIATALLQASEQSVGQVRRQLASLGRWFQQPITRGQILETAPALMLCLAYWRGEDWRDGETHDAADLGNAEPIDRYRLDDAIRIVADSIASRPTNRNLLAILAYPALLLFCCVVVSAFIATEIVPMFESMFDEFGLELPMLTRLLLAVSALIRSSLLPLLVVVLLLAAIRWIGGPLYRRWRWQSGRWTLPLVTPLRTRQRWADWAEHVSLLLRVGLSPSEACALADRSAAAKKLPNIAIPVAANGVLEPTAAWTLRPGVLWPGYQQLASAIAMPAGTAQVAKLQAIAEEYRDRQRGTTTNLAVWITPLFTIWIATVIGFVVTSLFMPLVDLITGLT